MLRDVAGCCGGRCIVPQHAPVLLRKGRERLLVLLVTRDDVTAATNEQHIHVGADVDQIVHLPYPHAAACRVQIIAVVARQHLHTRLFPVSQRVLLIPGDDYTQLCMSCADSCV